MALFLHKFKNSEYLEQEFFVARVFRISSIFWYFTCALMLTEAALINSDLFPAVL